MLHFGRRLEFTFYLNPASKNIEIDQLAFPLLDAGSSIPARSNAEPAKTHSTGGGCSFEVPGDTRLVVRSEVHDGPGQPVTVSLHCFDLPGVRCQVRQFDVPEFDSDASTIELLGRYCLPQWGDPANVTPGPTLKQGGLEGNEYWVAGRNPVRLRVFRSEGKVYVVSATTAADPLPGATEAGEAFLNSFRVAPVPEEKPVEN